MKLAKNLSKKVRNSTDETAKLDTSPKKSRLRISIPLDKNGRPIISKPMRSFSEADRRSYDSNSTALFTAGTTGTGSFESGMSTAYSNSPTTTQRFSQPSAPVAATFFDTKGFEAPPGKFWLWYLCNNTGMMVERHEIDLSYINQDEKCMLCDDLVFGPNNTVYTGWVKLKMEFKMLKEKPLREARELRAKWEEDAVKLQELEMHMEQTRAMRQELGEVSFDAALHRDAREALELRKRMDQEAHELQEIQQKMESEVVSANINGGGGIDYTKLEAIFNNSAKASITGPVEETFGTTYQAEPRYMREHSRFSQEI